MHPEGNRPARVGSTKRLAALAGVVVALLALLFVGRTIANQWDQVRDSILDAAPLWVAAGLGFAILSTLWTASTWTDVLRLLGATVARRDVLRWFFVGELAKYVPGGVFSVIGRAEMAHRGGVERATAYSSVALSLVGMYLAGLMYCAALLPFALGDGASAVALVLGLLPLGLIALHPKVLNPLLDFVRAKTGRDLNVLIPPWRETVFAVLRYLPSWVLATLAYAAITHALHPPEVNYARVSFAATLGWVAGFLVAPVPSGGGIREGVFIATSGLASGLAGTVAVAARLAFVLSDTVGALISGWSLRRDGES